MALGFVLGLVVLWGYEKWSARPQVASGIELSLGTDERSIDVQGQARPRNVILFVADGMGFPHLMLARMTLDGIGGGSSWDRFESTGSLASHSAGGFLTDSAAAATALATGHLTHPGFVGVGPEGEPLTSLLEVAAERGYRTGIVTDSYVWDATPAAFATHVADRTRAAEILQQLTASRLEVLFGELEDVGEDGVPEREPTLELLARRFEILDHELVVGLEDRPIAALFDEDEINDLDDVPNLPRMLEVALDRLSSDERPFVLLVESEEPDAASHDHDFERLVRGLASIDATLTALLDFIEEDGETLLLFTSDHETGGLALSIRGRDNRTLVPLWASEDHTGAPVPLMASGPGAEGFGGAWSSWQVGRALQGLLEVAARPEAPGCAPASP